jgi:serine O-acetyltransferase
MENGIIEKELCAHVNKQLSNILICNENVAPYISKTLERTMKCFKRTQNKYYNNEIGEPKFSIYHSGQYSIFLYYLANTIYNTGGNPLLAAKLYYLNKILNSVDWYYEIELPEYWGVEHPIGSVLGRADYSNGLFIYQGCTIGGNNGKYPVIGKDVILYSNVTVLGNTNIGNNVLISTGTTIKDEKIPSNCVVFGQTPNLVLREKDDNYFNDRISKFWKKDEGVI